MMYPLPTNSAPGQSPPNASTKRAAHPLFVPMWAAPSLLPQLPLLFPVDPDLPPSPKRQYRSQYRYPGPEDLLDEARRDPLSDFEIALRLVDFMPLERMLAAHYYTPSTKGQVPFHPVSMFLAICLRREQHLAWRELARLLAGDNGAGWRRLFGFAEGDTPSASGLRYFFCSVGPAVFDALCPRFVALLREHGLCPEQSTYPGDPEDRGVTITQDGMLHPARSRACCQQATDSCFQPLGAPDASPTEGGVPRPGRPCRAREKGLPGCACDTPACQAQCQRASKLDAEARLIHYEGHNNKHGTAQATEQDGGKGKGIDVFGFRSIAHRILDDRFAVSWNAQSKLYSANTDERSVFVGGLEGLTMRPLDLSIGEVLADSGVGYEPCLNAIFARGALRMVDIRADKGDLDDAVCLRRGYDGEGHPLCEHGYPMRSNGHDYTRQVTKYVCAQLCRREPRREGEAVAAVEGCPYLDESRPLGQVTNVGRTMPDGSARLARDIPYGSPVWKARYGRRNLSESRNGEVEGLGLKRMPDYGLERDNKEVQLVDFVINLRTLGRLVREATGLA
jgi:hypothetical protein